MSIASRLLNFKKGELPLAALSALFYFTVLCGYYFLRPVREAMGVSRGMDDLRWLFVATSIVSLIAVLLFSGVVSRFDRRRFIPIGYLFVIVCLFGFASLLTMDAIGGGGLIGTEAGTTMSLVVGYSFYIWLTTINLFVNSLFWAFMVDVFNVEQGKRMFAFIGIGGTLGALIGGWITNVISGMTESVYLPPGLMIAGAALFGVSIVLMLILDRMALASEHSHLSAGSTKTDNKAPNPAQPDSRQKIGGSAWDGVTAIIKSPYLIGIGGFIFLMAISNTLIYFTQAGVILENTDTFSERVGSFAAFDMATQIATLITQIFITTHLIRKLGVGWTLSILPLVTIAGFAVLAIWPLYGVMMIFAAVHRAVRYAVSRPARETLFSVLTPGEKYKAKPVIDVFLYRGGDLAGAGFEGGLRALGLGLTGLAAAAVPLSVGWAVLCLALGHAQKRKALEQSPEDAQPARMPENPEQRPAGG